LDGGVLVSGAGFVSAVAFGRAASATVGEAAALG